MELNLRRGKYVRIYIIHGHNSERHFADPETLTGLGKKDKESPILGMTPAMLDLIVLRLMRFLLADPSDKKSHGNTFE